MNKIIALAALFAIPAAFADSAQDYDWAMKITGLEDARLALTSCNSDEGSYYFARPKTANPTYYCMGGIKGTKDMAIVYKKKNSNSKTYFRVSDCGQRTGAVDPDGERHGDVSQACSVRAMNVKTLAASGRASKITFNTQWDYSEGGTTFQFTIGGKKYWGAPVDFQSLRHDGE